MSKLKELIQLLIYQKLHNNKISKSVQKFQLLTAQDVTVIFITLYCLLSLPLSNASPLSFSSCTFTFDGLLSFRVVAFSPASLPYVPTWTAIAYKFFVAHYADESQTRRINHIHWLVTHRSQHSQSSQSLEGAQQWGRQRRLGLIGFYTLPWSVYNLQVDDPFYAVTRNSLFVWRNF